MGLLSKLGVPKVTPEESQARNDRARKISEFVRGLSAHFTNNQSPELSTIVEHGISQSVTDFLKSSVGKSFVDRIISIKEMTPEDVVKDRQARLVWFRSHMPEDFVNNTVKRFLRKDLLDTKIRGWWDDFSVEAAALGRLGVNAQVATRLNRTTLVRVGKMFVAKQDQIDDNLAELSLAFDELIDIAEQDPAILGIIEARWNRIMGDPPFTLNEFESVMNTVATEFYEAGAGARDLASSLLADTSIKDKLVNTSIKNRALLIARTEVGILQGEAAAAAITDAGFTHKEWLTTRDGKVRDAHLDNESDGAIPVDKSFSDGSTNTGFGNLSPWNCRCDMVGVVIPGDPIPKSIEGDFEGAF